MSLLGLHFERLLEAEAASDMGYALVVSVLWCTLVMATNWFLGWNPTWLIDVGSCDRLAIGM